MSETLSDITVKLNVDQPSTPVNMGVLAIFTKGETPDVKSYYTLGDVQEDFAQNTDLLAVAQGYFAQKYHGEKLVVITYSESIAAATAAKPVNFICAVNSAGIISAKTCGSNIS